VVPVPANEYRGQVKQITYAESSWLVGDDTADAIIEYAVLLARIESADSVRVAAISADGREHEVTLLIGPATMMTAEAVDLEIEEPDNTVAIAEIYQRMGRITAPPNARPYDAAEILGLQRTESSTFD
jgi:hypothetical protein